MKYLNALNVCLSLLCVQEHPPFSFGREDGQGKGVADVFKLGTT